MDSDRRNHTPLRPETTPSFRWVEDLPSLLFRVMPCGLFHLYDSANRAEIRAIMALRKLERLNLYWR